MGSFVVIRRSQRLSGEGLPMPFPCALGRLRVLWNVCKSAHSDVMRSPVTCSAISHQCEPMSAMRARGPALFRLDAPVPIRVVEQPVLRVSSLRHQDLAQIAGFAHAPHLLHHRVIAQVVAGAVAQLLLMRQFTSAAASFARYRQRLLAQHVLAGFERSLGHREMRRVGRADVDRPHARDPAAPCVYAASSRPPTLTTSTVAQPSQGFCMHAAHEPAADYRRSHGHRLTPTTPRKAAPAARSDSGNAAARLKPSSADSRLSSCSIESTES